jgi:hypothetical protein
MDRCQSLIAPSLNFRLEFEEQKDKHHNHDGAQNNLPILPPEETFGRFGMIPNFGCFGCVAHDNPF